MLRIKVALLLVIFSASCRQSELMDDDASSVLSEGGEIYLQASLSDFAVKRKRSLHEIAVFWRKDRFPVHIHALEYKSSEVTLNVQDRKAEISPVFSHILFSYKRDNKTYTCVLREVKLGEHKTIDVGNNCYEQEGTNDTIYHFVNACVHSDTKVSRFIFTEISQAQHWACDIAKGDGKIMLPSYCFIEDYKGKCSFTTAGTAAVAATKFTVLDMITNPSGNFSGNFSDLFNSIWEVVASCLITDKGNKVECRKKDSYSGGNELVIEGLGGGDSDNGNNGSGTSDAG